MGRGKGLGEDNNEPMYVIHAFCPLLFFLQILVLLTIYSLLVKCKWYRKRKGKGRDKVRHASTASDYYIFW